MMTLSDIKTIAARGSGLIIDATKINATDINGILLSGKKENAHVTIINALHLTSSDAISIATTYTERVTFDFSVHK